MDFREKILKEGVLKHRQTSYALPRWKTRYVVFKISGGGRLQFIIYKELPTSPANEVKEIPIEEFGGLESSGKVDSEKHVFSVITTNVTDSFSMDSPEELCEWTILLQEYLGKELTFGIVIPQKHGQLKSGRGVLRIRNTGFTITTCDSPPRCMGTWQIIHIRKFGGSDSFKFQTGSKCPSGEHLYTLQTDDNAKVKALFNDLSQHKPIFCDDRVGRRMTLERNNHHGPYRQSPSRFSLQSTTGKDGRDSPTPTYENKEAITEAAQRLRKRNCPPPLPPPYSHHSTNDNRTPLPQVQRTQTNTSPLSPAKPEDQRLYQNIPRTTPGAGPHSPTKHRGRYPVPPSEPVPDGYYNVSPPLVLKKYPPYQSSSSSLPNLSQEENAFFPEFAIVPPPPIKTVSRCNSTTQELYGDTCTYLRLNSQQRPTMMIEGENLVVHRIPNGGVGEGEGRGEAVFPGKDEVGMYQNLDFKSKRSSGMIATTSNVYMEDTDGGAVHSPGLHRPVIPDLDMQTELVHNYTNVDFAMESAHRRPPLSSTKQLARAGDVRRKVSAPPLSRDRPGATTSNSPVMSVGTLAPVTSNLSLSLHPKLKPSFSSHDLQLAERQQTRKSESLPEYYNLFVPQLPAFQHMGKQSLGSKTGIMLATLSNFPAAPDSPSAHCASSKQQDRKRFKEGTDMVDYAPEPSQQEKQKMARLAEHLDEDDDDDDRVLVNPTRAVTSKLDITGTQTKMPTPQYDHLELVRSASGTCTPRFSPIPSPSPENLSRGNTPRPSTYDQLELSPNGEKSEEKESCSSPPQPLVNSSPVILTHVYERKVGVVGHTHNYEYIEVALKGTHGDSTGSRVPGPEISATPRHNSDPGRSVSLAAQSSVNNELDQNLQSLRDHETNFNRTPSTQPRRKPLPLQCVPLDASFDNLDPKPQESATVHNEQRSDKPYPKPRKTTTSAELVSSSESSKSLSPKIRQRSHSPSQQEINKEAVMTGSPSTPQNLWSRNDSGSSGDSLSPPTPKRPPKVPPKLGKQKSNESTISNGDIGGHPPPQTNGYKSTTPNLYKLVQKGSRSLDAVLPPHPKDQAGFTVSLPVTEFQFNKPLVPPRPRFLEQKHTQTGIEYAAMAFTHTEDELNYAQVCPNARRSPVITGSSRDTNKVMYQSINFEVTEGLRKTREDVEHQRSREIEWLEQREQKLKALTATAK